MSLIAIGTATMAPVPEGTYIGRCVQVIDLGTQYSKTYNKSQPKVMIRWELPQETYTDAQGCEQPRIINQQFTKSLNEKAGLRKMLEGWRSKKFSNEELAGFDLAVLVGLPCMITVVHSIGANGSTYANISAVAALPKGMEAPPQINESVVYDIDNPEDEDKFDSFPDFIQKLIMNSQEKDETADLPSIGDLDCNSSDDDLPF